MPESSPKKVLIWGVNYSPEQTGIAPQNVWMAQQFVKAGYSVEVVTSFPYYPAWKLAESDKGESFRTDEINRVRVHRCRMYVPKRPRLLKRMLQQFTFMLTSTYRILTLPKADLYVGVSPPFLISPILRIVAALKNKPYGIHIQDFEVAAAYETSGLSKALYSILSGIENWGLKKALQLSTISEAMLPRLNEKLPNEKTQDATILANFAKSQASFRVEDMRNLRARYSAKKLLFYSGNLGDKQVLDDLVIAINQFPKEELEWVIAGQGAQRKSLEALVEGLGSDNIHLIDLLPSWEYAMTLEAADFCVISERTQMGSWMPSGICFASKMLSYMKQGKPLLVYADQQSEISQIVAKNQCGIRLENKESIESMLDRLINVQDLSSMQDASKNYYLQYRSKFGFESWLEGFLPNNP